MPAKTPTKPFQLSDSGMLSLPEAIRLAMISPRRAIAALCDNLRETRPRFPRVIQLTLTNRCNFACPMCAQGQVRSEQLDAGAVDLPIEVARRVIAECRPYGPHVHLFGGEPLLYKGLHELIAFIRRNHLIAFLTTNGLLLERHAASLAGGGLGALHISLDGWDEESQRKRGNVPGSFDRIVNGMQAFTARKKGMLPILRVSTVITQHNYHSLHKIQEVIRELGVQEWTIVNHFFIPRRISAIAEQFRQVTGIGETLPLHIVDDERYLSEDQARELKDCLDTVRANSAGMRIDHNWATDLKAYYSSQQPSPKSRCDMAFYRLDVHPDGRLTLCAGGFTIGSVYDSTIRAVWNGERARYFGDVYRQKSILPMCFRCCGIQRSITFSEAGQPQPA